MTQFDQRDQQVGTQYNAGRDIHHSTTTNKTINNIRRPWLFGIGAVVLILIAIGFIFTQHHDPSEDPQTVVDHYYKALENGDYNTAIKYLHVTNALNPSMNVTTAGELKQQEQSWQGVYGGPIKSHTMSNPSVNDQTASVTVTVMRGGSYTMAVELSQINGAWVITGAGAPGYLY